MPKDVTISGRHASRIADRMQRAVAAVQRSRGAMPVPQVLVQAPGFEFAAGDRERRFHAASVGKWMTATLALQLAEQGRLDLDAPVASVLPRDECDGLFVPGARPTVADLITHTSGVADYFEGRSRAPRPFVDGLTEDRDRVWTPADLLAYSREWQAPVGAPGERFAYSDTGYVLLGRVIEQAGGASLGGQLHERIFARAGMAESCLLFHTMPGGAQSSAAPAADLEIAPLWLGRAELSRAASISCDWGGGGVVSTLDDLARFADAWMSGALVGAASRARMLRFAHRFRPGIHYGAGLMQLRYEGFFPLLRGMPRTVGHLGVTGVHLFVAPERGIRIILNFHSTREMTRSFRTHIRLLQELLRGGRAEPL